MSHNLKMASILAANQLVQKDPWILLLQLQLDPQGSPGDIVYLANNRDDYPWSGNTYLAFNFTLDDYKISSQGALPTLTMRVSNINGAMQGELEAHGGGVDANVTILAVNNGAQAGEPELTLVFTVMSTTCDEQWAAFTLGGSNPLRSAFPSQIYMSNYCRHTYNSPTFQRNGDPRGRMCNYFGNLTSCSKFKEGANGCRVHNNLLNFGGHQTIDTTGFRAAVPN